MEYALGATVNVTIPMIEVLILVVMEYALGAMKSMVGKPIAIVLILVVMEYALGGHNFKQ